MSGAERSDVLEELNRVAREIEPALYRAALCLCGNPADAKDLVQDTFERGLRNADRYRPGTNPRAWLTAIMRNLFIDRCRSQRARPRSQPLDDAAVSAAEPESEPAWASLTTADLRRAAARLSPEFRQVFELRTFDDASYEEIARQLGIPRATVATRLRRARRKLRAHLLDTVDKNAREAS